MQLLWSAGAQFPQQWQRDAIPKFNWAINKTAMDIKDREKETNVQDKQNNQPKKRKRA